MTDNWPIIQLPAGPSDAELEAERDDKHRLAVAFDTATSYCRVPAPERYGAFGVWPVCALSASHEGDHATTWGTTWPNTGEVS
jgi:hypothetical protein